MSGVNFTRSGAKRLTDATKRVERMPRGRETSRRTGQGSGESLIFFQLQEPLQKAGNSLMDARAAQATAFFPDEEQPAYQPDDASSYVPAVFKTSTPPRTIWVVNRSLDFEGITGGSGMAQFVGGEWLVIWVDCTALN